MLSRRLKSRMNPDTVQFTGVTGNSTSSTTLTFSAAEAGDVGIIFSNRNPGGGAGPSGWTTIASGTRGAVYANTMTGGETSVTFLSAPNQAVVAFFRNCVEPTAAELTYSASTVDPNAPVSVVSAVPQDIVLVATCASFTTESYTETVPVGYTDIVSLVSATHMISLGLATGLTGTQNPPAVDWNLDGAAQSAAATIIIERS